MTAFDRFGRIRNFPTPQSIVEEYFDVRLEHYERRLHDLRQRCEREAAIARNRSRFVRDIVEGQLAIMGESNGGREALRKAEIEQILRSKGFSAFPSISSPNQTTSSGVGYDTTVDTEDLESRVSDDFAYLLDMPIRSMTAERAEQLARRAAKASSDLENLQRCSREDLWQRDLSAVSEYIAVNKGSV